MDMGSLFVIFGIAMGSIFAISRYGYGSTF